MAIAYTPPGVYVTETSQPAVSPLLGTAADICVVGTAPPPPATPGINATDVVMLSGTNPVLLPTLANLNNAQLLAVQSVTNTLEPQATGAYSVTTDYVVTTGEGPPAGSAGTIARVSTGTIPDQSLVTVTYTYLPVDYWQPIRLFDIGSVESRFGPSWTTATAAAPGGGPQTTYYTGVASPLSMAARIAFENGAQSVICQPLFARATPGDPTTAQQPPTVAQVGNQATWQDTLYSLRPISDIDVIVPVVGQDGVNVSDSGMLSIFTAVQTHLAYMNTQQQYIVAIFGEDGTTEGVGTTNSGLLTTIRNTHAPSLQANFGNNISSQCVLINNTVYQRPTPGGLGTAINVGGQYAAAAVAGALGARSVSASLTRQPILGFSGVIDPRTPADKNLDAGSGLFVIEQVTGGVLRCRQGITLDIQNGPPKAELSVVRGKHLLIESIRATLDNQIIGNIIADANSPIVVRSAISGVLGLLQQARAIVDYSPVQAALTNLNPTTITASFSYKPAFPVNYINVSFSLDLTTGSISTSGTAAANPSS